MGMIRKHGNMIADAQGYIIVTANSTLKNNGRLVMGAGEAKMLKDIYPDIDKSFGRLLADNYGTSTSTRYGLILNRTMKLGAFQTKTYWKNKSDIDLIRLSVAKLTIEALSNPKETYNLNFPDIGYGGLNKSDVEPILQVLPDNVHVWTYE